MAGQAQAGPIALHDAAQGSRPGAHHEWYIPGTTTGTPIQLLIENTDQRSRDYRNIADRFRPGHADYTYSRKYGIRDYRGGGRASARETASRVAAGAIARKILGPGVTIRGALSADRPSRYRPDRSGIGAQLKRTRSGVPMPPRRCAGPTTSTEYVKRAPRPAPSSRSSQAASRLGCGRAGLRQA